MQRPPRPRPQSTNPISPEYDKRQHPDVLPDEKPREKLREREGKQPARSAGPIGHEGSSGTARRVGSSGSNSGSSALFSSAVKHGKSIVSTLNVSKIGKAFSLLRRSKPLPKPPSKDQQSPDATGSLSHQENTAHFGNVFSIPTLFKRPVNATDVVSLLGPRTDDKAEENPVARLDERRAANRRARLRKIGICVALCIAIIIPVWILFFSPLFSLQQSQVKLEGNVTDIPKKQVVEAAKPWDGVPLLRVDVHSIEKSVEKVPMVRHAEVRRAFPHGLVIHVEPRLAEAVEIADGKERLVDSQDQPVAGKVRDGVPRIVVPSDSRKRPAAITQGLKVWSLLSKELRKETRGVNCGGSEITLELSNDRIVRWGDTSSSEVKAKVLSILLEKRPAKVYDITAPTRPVTS